MPATFADAASNWVDDYKGEGRALTGDGMDLAWAVELFQQIGGSELLFFHVRTSDGELTIGRDLSTLDSAALESLGHVCGTAASAAMLPRQRQTADPPLSVSPT